MCAQPAPDHPAVLPDNTGLEPPATPPRPRSRISPLQWVGLTALVLLFLYQFGDLVSQIPLLIAIVIAVTIHEFSHARIATWFGDDLPRRTGRLTLNPLAHLDPMGSLLFLVAHFGWGKPVQINPSAMRNPNLGWALSSAAGPASNLISAAIVVSLLVTVGRPADSFLHEVVKQFVGISITLAIFNLIPIPPLDGFGFLFGLSPRPLKIALLPLQRYGSLILLALVFLPTFSRSFPPILSNLLRAGTNLFFTVLGVPASAL